MESIIFTEAGPSKWKAPYKTDILKGSLRDLYLAQGGFLPPKIDSPEELHETGEDLPGQPIALDQAKERQQPASPASRRFPKTKAQLKLLNGWFDSNPHPTVSQLHEYAELSGLEKDQVRTWFANHRHSGRRDEAHQRAGMIVDNFPVYNLSHDILRQFLESLFGDVFVEIKVF
jgi:hypothetical protein